MGIASWENHNEFFKVAIDIVESCVYIDWIFNLFFQYLKEHKNALEFILSIIEKVESWLEITQ